MNTLRGVTAVDYQITVRQDFAAGETGEGIGRALSQHTGREARQMVVVVRDGTVRHGTIGAHAEHETARGAAWSRVACMRSRQPRSRIRKVIEHGTHGKNRRPRLERACRHAGCTRRLRVRVARGASGSGRSALRTSLQAFRALRQRARRHPRGFARGSGLGRVEADENDWRVAGRRAVSGQ